MMVVRKKIGLVFIYSEQWIGGTYYIMNLIHALNSLADERKPFLYIFSRPEDYQKLLKEVSYPYMQFVHMEENPDHPFLQWVNRAGVRFLSRKLFKKRFSGQIDAIFPFQRNHYIESIPMEKRYYWIADFQDRRLPQFFTEEDLQEKGLRHQWIADHAQHLVLSSEASHRDWKTYYPSAGCNVHVIHFAVTHPEFRNVDFSDLSRRYALATPYFFSPNQFWAHKNQLVVIKAAELLKAKGKQVRIYFSGKENDNRNPGYVEGLKSYVKEKGLEEEIRFLGFLDRKDQLQILNHSRAVIQPSLFEGWSTSVEDAMAIGKPVIASSLDVNREQLGEQGIYFSPTSPEELAARLESIVENTPEFTYSYDNKVKTFAEDFLSILEN